MFSRPVDTIYPLTRGYGARSSKHVWSIDPDNGLWIPIQDKEGLGHHTGLDYSCPLRTVVRAMADGFVVRSQFENSMDTQIGAGLYLSQLVRMVGYDSWMLRYSHLSAIFVYPSQEVKKGQAIAMSGNSGNTQGNEYLHVDLQDLRYQWREIPFEETEPWSLQ